MSGILHVCTGNLCRSPMAEVLLRAGLRGRFGAGPDLVPIASAGTEARDGRAMWPFAVDELARRGLMSGRFVSRRLDPVTAADADLVLTATRAHRDAVVSAAPPAAGRVFTWRELAWLLDGATAEEVPGATPAQRLRPLAALAGIRRAQLDSPPAETMDIADPMGRDASFFAAAADNISLALTPLVELL